MSDDPRFDWMHLDYVNVADIARSMATTLSPLRAAEDDALYGIVSDDDGGIIAYAIGVEHAKQIVAALNAPVPA